VFLLAPRAPAKDGAPLALTLSPVHGGLEGAQVLEGAHDLCNMYQLKSDPLSLLILVFIELSLKLINLSTKSTSLSVI
jgi:hypothetical protein